MTLPIFNVVARNSYGREFVSIDSLPPAPRFFLRAVHGPYPVYVSPCGTPYYHGDEYFVHCGFRGCFKVIHYRTHDPACYYCYDKHFLVLGEAIQHGLAVTYAKAHGYSILSNIFSI